MNPLLNLNEISHAWGKHTIFDRINLRMCCDECVALIGPNGCGKTTLLRLAAGLLTPQSGSVAFSGKNLSIIPRQQLSRQIALVPQKLDIPFSFTVQQVIEMGRTPYLGIWGTMGSSDRIAVQRAMELTDTGSLRHRIFNQLSGGEQQRVKIALGLAQEPRLLLLDEPAQSLDFGRQMELMALIRMLKDEGIAILAAVHDLASIHETFSSVVLVLPQEGVRKGPPEEILQAELLAHAFQCPAPRFDFAPRIVIRKGFAR